MNSVRARPAKKCPTEEPISAAYVVIVLWLALSQPVMRLTHSSGLK